MPSLNLRPELFRNLSIFSLVVALLALVGWPSYECATHPVGAIDYCYLQHVMNGGGSSDNHNGGEFVAPSYWLVYGHVPWHKDELITRTLKFDEAIDVRDNKCTSKPAAE